MKVERSRFPVKRLSDGRALLNLGSSARVAPGWNNVDFSWLIRLGRHPRLCAVLHRLGWLSEDRYLRILKLDRDTVLWDLSRGIPFAKETFDAVYHCHLLEHLDREVAPAFLQECHRVLKPGGILRVVVPDLEKLARGYLGVVDRLPDQATLAQHRSAVEKLFEQMVVRIPKIRKEQKLFVQFLEHIFIGSTARSGTMHRWMYDQFSLGQLVREAGFYDTQVLNATTSQIAGWHEFHLDTELDGAPYKAGSLYLEGRKT